MDIYLDRDYLYRRHVDEDSDAEEQHYAELGEQQARELAEEYDRQMEEYWAAHAPPDTEDEAAEPARRQ